MSVRICHGDGRVAVTRGVKEIPLCGISTDERRYT
jgi:hypothetical protein